MNVNSPEFFHCGSPRVLKHLLDNGHMLWVDPDEIQQNPYLYMKTRKYKGKECSMNTIYIFKHSSELDKCIAEISSDDAKARYSNQ